jgi:5-methylcytosine-specific restriction protein A
MGSLEMAQGVAQPLAPHSVGPLMLGVTVWQYESTFRRTRTMTPIQLAREYIRTRVQDPALQHPDLAKEFKGKVKNSNIWLERFTRVGDLIVYIKRFQLGTNDPTYQAMHGLGLLTFEDIAADFENEFSLWANDCTRPTDFIVGEKYSSHEILIFVRNYDPRSGGMFVLDAGGKPACVIIKATLSGGVYPNEWLDEPKRLKYYLKSITNPKTKKTDFGEHFQPNSAILHTANIPVLTFVRKTETGPFVFHGVFKYVSIKREQDGSKWFELMRDEQDGAVIENSVFNAKIFAEETKYSRQSPRDQRLARLATAPKKPLKTLVLSTAYKRNPDVVAEVLERANGECEYCHKPAPFQRRNEGGPYLEVHHRLPLADDGEDTVENAIAACPNCHRKAHYG